MVVTLGDISLQARWITQSTETWEAPEVICTKARDNMSGVGYLA
jgi:hypothetical protein